jgi:hypothetical protein
MELICVKLESTAKPAIQRHDEREVPKQPTRVNRVQTMGKQNP